MPKQPVIVIHGGQGTRFRGPKLIQIQNSLRTKLEWIYPRLLRGMSAIEAAAQAVALLEDDPLYNAGYGSKIQSDGKIRMSASIMDGFRRRFAGCVNVEGVKNPVFLAQALLKKPDRVLSTEGAKRFAREIGLHFASPFTPEQLANFRAKKKGKKGTVGAVVLDRMGRLAAATSTGGRGFEYPFRVSDSPTVAGNFANEFAAVSATGTGEQIVEQAAASTICAFLEAGMPLKEALARTIARSKKYHADYGVIAVNRQGQFKATVTKGSITWGAHDRQGVQLLK